MSELQATGIVTGHAARGNGVVVSRLLYPVVTFETEERKTVEFESKLGSNMPPRVGEKVTVLYDPSRPQEASLVLGSTIWPRRWMLLVGAGILLLALPAFLAALALVVVFLAALL